MKSYSLGFAAMLAGCLIAAAAWMVLFAAAPLPAAAAPARLFIAQAGQGSAAQQVSPTQVQKYVKVYLAMQKDHSLTVAQAAGAQGLTVAQFREIENKIMSNPALHQMVRAQLAPTPTPSPAAK